MGNFQDSSNGNLIETYNSHKGDDIRVEFQ